MRTLVRAQCNAPASNRFFFDDIFGKEFFGGRTAPFTKSTPAVNIKEDEKQFSLEVAAPGLKKEDFKVELAEGVLSISAEIKTENQTEKENFTRKEFSYQCFTRSFTLDEETVDAEKISAKYEDGILSLGIPKKVKTEEEKKAKTITIS